MRIGIDARLWNESGVGRYTRNLIDQLQALDKNNEYILFVQDKDYGKIKGQISNIKWKIVKTNVRWHSFSEQTNFPRILNKENLDLVHFPYFSVPIFYNKPFVVTIHDLIINHFPTGKASTLFLPFYQLKLLGYKYVISKAAKKARKIITVSNATRDEIADHLKVNPDKITVTYEGISKITNDKSQIKNIKIQNKSYFLYVGNAYPHKNLERLFQAFNFLIPQYPSIFLVLVGREDYFYKKLKEKAESMNLSSHVEFLGDAKDEELFQLYKNAKALVLPSLMEGFGLPALEAMANKCLVLCSDIPAFREICKDSAIYFDPKNIQNMSDQMKQVVNHSNDSYYYSDLKQKGLERSKQFSWEKMAKETLNVYNSFKL